MRVNPPQTAQGDTSSPTGLGETAILGSSEAWIPQPVCGSACSDHRGEMRQSPGKSQAIPQNWQMNSREPIPAVKNRRPHASSSGLRFRRPCFSIARARGIHRLGVRCLPTWSPPMTRASLLAALIPLLVLCTPASSQCPSGGRSTPAGSGAGSSSGAGAYADSGSSGAGSSSGSSKAKSGMDLDVLGSGAGGMDLALLSASASAAQALCSLPWVCAQVTQGLE